MVYCLVDAELYCRLAEDAQVEPFQNASGISRQQFTASEKDLTPAFQSVSLSRPSTSLPSTPQRNAMYRNFIPSSSSSSSASISSSAKSTAELTPEAKFQRAKDVISGAAFASTSSKSSPLFNRVAAVSDFNSHNGTPQTPTSRRLSDRSSIKETHIFDPSDLDTTPTKKSVVFDTSTLAHSGGQSKKRSQEVIEQVDLVPRKALLASKRRRHKILIGYPAGEPLRKGRFEVMGEWDDSHCKERVKKYMEALQRCQDSSGWQADEVMGEIQLTELN